MKFDEFNLIKHIKAISGAVREGDVILSIGDDAAAVQHGGKRLTLFTCDILIEGVHFDLSYTSPYQLGRRAIAVNLSDIAAMGGRPSYVLVSLVLPPQLDQNILDEMYRGMVDHLHEFSAKIIGGNLASTTDKMIIDLFMIGRVKPDEMLTRSGARAGDRLFVTGKIGSSQAGLQLLKIFGNSPSGQFSNLIEAHLSPIPRVQTGRLLAASGWVTAMIDISDGLAADLGHMAEASGVDAEIYKEKIPIAHNLFKAADSVKVDPWELVLFGGEDYELLFSLKPDTPDSVIAEIGKKAAIEITEIGRIVDGAGEIWLTSETGERVKLEPKGWRHF